MQAFVAGVIEDADVRRPLEQRGQDLGPSMPRLWPASIDPGARYRVLGLLVQERFDGPSDAGGIHDVGKVALARDRVLGHVRHSLREVS